MLSLYTRIVIFNKETTYFEHITKAVLNGLKLILAINLQTIKCLFKESESLSPELLTAIQMYELSKNVH